jgi:hypothetical protein
LSRQATAVLIVSIFLTRAVLAQTGGIQGIVLDSKNKPVNNSLVIAGHAPASGAADPKGRNLHAITDKAGAFSFSALPVGSYRICVQAPATDLLDPCQWSAPVIAKVIAGQAGSPVHIVLDQGIPLNIRIDDVGQLLAKSEGKIAGAHLSVGVWGGNNLFHAAPIAGKDSSGRNHMIYVPKGRLVHVSAFSKYFHLAEAPTTAVNAPTSGSQQIKFTVTSGGPK